MSLRMAFGASLGALVAMALAIATGLIVATDQVAKTASALSENVHRVRLAQHLQIDLLLHARAVDELRKADEAQRMREEIAESEGYRRSVASQAAFQDASRAIRTYLTAPNADSLRVAYAAADQFVNAEESDATALAHVAADWRTRAIALGATLGLLLVLAATGILFWFRTATLRPILELNRAMRSYAAGDRSAAAPQEGAREVREIGQAYERMREALRQQREDQVTFLAGVAHDLRNPLTALRLAHAVVREGKAVSETRLRSIVQITGRQVEQLDRMVGDLLDSTRLDAGRLELRLGSVDLGALAEEAAQLIRSATPDRAISVDRPAQPLLAWADPTRVEQVLVNLLSNAVKYSPDPSPIDVRVGREGDQAFVEVRDRGPGLSDEDKRRIFEPFRRVGAPSAAPGTGLGLYVARRLVEAHHGELSVENAPGGGSIFRIRLPGVNA